MATTEEFWDVFSASRMPMLVMDDDAVYTAANDAACEALGRPVRDIVGHRMGFTTAPERLEKLYELWARLRRTGYVVVPWQFLLPDGRTVDVEAICTRDSPEPGMHLSLYWPRRRPGDRGALTEREQEITRLLACGLTGEEIADRLYLSPATVRTHIRNAMAHIGAQTRVQLVALALARGVIPPDPEG